MNNIVKPIAFAAIIALCVSCSDSDYNAFMQAKQSQSVEQLEQYISDYPQGEYLDEARQEIVNVMDDNAYIEALQKGTCAALQDYLNQYSPDGRHCIDAENEMKRIESERWSNNFLSTGSTPYRDYYGSGNSCNSWYCSQIKVTGPHGADVVVIIKKDNSDGSVVRHAYIRSGDTYTFNVPNGRYQVFFYFGNGWNPNKEMSGGVRGGFVKDEQFSKDYSEYIADEVLSYVLQLTVNGNFSTSPSTENEMF